MSVTPIARHPCPICGASWRGREHLCGAFELCTRCGFAIRLNGQGELIAWATTNVSHPRGVLAAAVLLAVVLASASCAPLLQPIAGTAATTGADPQRGVLLGEELPGDTWVCVPRLAPTALSRYACMRLVDLRVLLRTRRVAGGAAPEPRP